MKNIPLFISIFLLYGASHAQGVKNVSKNAPNLIQIDQPDTTNVSAQLILAADYALIQKKEKSIVVLGSNLQTKRITIEAQARCITPDEKETYDPPKREAVCLSPETQPGPKKITKTVIVPPVELIPKN